VQAEVPVRGADRLARGAAIVVVIVVDVLVVVVVVVVVTVVVGFSPCWQYHLSLEGSGTFIMLYPRQATSSGSNV
jgi:hypothetical protein